MRVTRVFVGEPLARTRTCSLPEAAANHVTRVLRLREGAAISPSTATAASTVRDPGRRPAIAYRCGSERRTAGLPESRLRITLVQASRAANAWTGRCRKPRNSACAHHAGALRAQRRAARRRAGREEAAPLAGDRGRCVRAKRSQIVPGRARPAGNWGTYLRHRAARKPAFRVEPGAARCRSPGWTSIGGTRENC